MYLQGQIKIIKDCYHTNPLEQCKAGHYYFHAVFRPDGEMKEFIFYELSRPDRVVEVLLFL